MSDWTDLLDIAGDLLENQDLDKMMKQGSKWLKKMGVDLNPALQGKPSAPGGAEQTETAPLSLAEERMQAERLVPEPLVPEKMEPEKMTPDSPAPEGESADWNKNIPLRPAAPQGSEALRALTEIASRGLGGAIMADEILEPPLAVRSGYLARYRRRMR